jgi:hypothetical protein
MVRLKRLLVLQYCIIAIAKIIYRRAGFRYRKDNIVTTCTRGGRYSVEAEDPRLQHQAESHVRAGCGRRRRRWQPPARTGHLAPTRRHHRQRPPRLHSSSSATFARRRVPASAGRRRESTTTQVPGAGGREMRRPNPS